jgi:hypothetical protein
MLVMGIKFIGRRAEIHPAGPRSCSTAYRVLAAPRALGGCLIEIRLQQLDLDAFRLEKPIAFRSGYPFR